MFGGGLFFSANMFTPSIPLFVVVPPFSEPHFVRPFFFPHLAGSFFPPHVCFLVMVLRFFSFLIVGNFARRLEFPGIDLRFPNNDRARRRLL